MLKRMGSVAVIVAVLAGVLTLASASPAQAAGFERMTGRIKTAGQPNQPCPTPRVVIYLEDGGLLFADGTPDGRYAVESLPAGDHMVVLACTTGDWALETFRGKRGFDFEGFEPVHIIEDVTTSEINAVLAPAGSVSGTIGVKGGGFPQDCSAVAWVVDAAGIVQTFGPCASPTDGTYLIQGAPKGRSYVQFLGNETYVGQWWKNAADMAGAKLVKVDVGLTTTGIDARMRPVVGPPMRAASNRAPVVLPNGLVVPAA